ALRSRSAHRFCPRNSIRRTSLKKEVTKKDTTPTKVATRRVRRVWMRQLLILLSVIGPGLITANVDNDATGITGYSLAGAQYGYGLLWAVVLVTISLAVV